MTDLAYLEVVFHLLASDKALPKFQFERRVDALLAPFMEEILSVWIGGSVTAVVPEFPIKRTEDFQSTNVDHLFLCLDPTVLRPWIFFELKTDRHSVSPKQIGLYLEAMKLGMDKLRSDIAGIAAHSRRGKKYKALLDRFAAINAANDKIQLVVLSPVALPKVAAQVGSQGTVHTFDELLDFESSAYPDEWALFKAVLLPVLLDAA